MSDCAFQIPKWCFGFIYCILIYVNCSPLAAEDAIPEEVLENLKSATVFIRTPSGSGSGFMLEKSGKEGLVVTNAHVVCPSPAANSAPHTALGKQVDCIFNSGTKKELTLRGTISAFDPQRDLAFLAVSHDDLPGIIDAKSNVNVRETLPVFPIGFPFGDVLATNRRSPAVTISTSRVTSIREDEYGKRVAIQLNGGIDSGNSGGPVVTVDGHLVGISVAKLRDSDICFAIPAAQIDEFVQGRVVSDTLTERGIGPNGKLIIEVTVRLIDPKKRVSDVSVEVAAKDKILASGGRGDDGQFGPAAAEMKSFPLRLSNGFASGHVYLDTIAGHPLPSRYQIKITRRDGGVVFTCALGLDRASIAEDVAELKRRKTDAESRANSPVTPDHAPPTPEDPVLEFVPPTVPAARLGRIDFEGELLCINFPAQYQDVHVGGAGRYFLLHAPERGELAIFDLFEQKITHTINVPVDARITAGLTSFVVARPFHARLERWSLERAEKVSEAILPFRGNIKEICLGSGSAGPLLVNWVSGMEVNSTPFCALLELDTFEVIHLKQFEHVHDGRIRQPLQIDPKGEFSLYGDPKLRISLRASVAGNSFGMWFPDLTPQEIKILTLAGEGAFTVRHVRSGNHVVPSADGSGICTGIGYFSRDLTSTQRKEYCLPTFHPRYYLVSAVPPPHRFPTQKLPPFVVSVIDSEEDKVVDNFEIPEEAVADAVTNEFERKAPCIPPDKRIHCLPQSRCAVILAPKGDRIWLRKLTFEFLPFESQQDSTTDAPSLANIPAEAVRGSATDDGQTRASEPTSKLRIWTERNGGRQVKAEFVSAAGDKIRLRRADGKEVNVSLSILSEEDRKYVDSVRSERK